MALEKTDSLPYKTTKHESSKASRKRPVSLIMGEKNSIKKTHSSEKKDITPLRSIKDSDLRLQLTLQKIVHIPDGLDIGMTETFTTEQAYEGIINVIAFPVFAITGQKENNLEKNEYSKFCKMLKNT